MFDLIEQMFDDGLMARAIRPEERMRVDAEPLSELRYAVAASQFGGGQVTVSRRVRKDGLGAFEDLLDSLQPAQRALADETADRLHHEGVEAVLLGDERYPSVLASTPAPPAVLFVRGPWRLLHRPGLGLCGSRDASEEGLRAASACGEAVASRGFTVVSGYARGVDMAAHTAALRVGGATVIVLAEGIERFRIRKGPFAGVWDDSHAVVVSQFAPGQPWNAGSAMTRNGVISGLSRALLVVEAGEKGGTLAAGLHALDRGQAVLVLQLFGSPPGNEVLLRKGAKVVRSRAELEGLLDDLPANGSGQLSLI